MLITERGAAQRRLGDGAPVELGRFRGTEAGASSEMGSAVERRRAMARKRTSSANSLTGCRMTFGKEGPDERFCGTET
jgi:hypothetical protein